MERLMSKTTFFLAAFFAFYASPTFAEDYAERYKEQKVYWDRIYNDIEKNYGDGYQVNIGFINTSPVAGSTVWAPMVYHIAILEDALSNWEKKKYADHYKKAKFPLYCGYVILGHDKSFTFIKKTDLPLESVTQLLHNTEKRPPVEDGQLFLFHAKAFGSHKIEIIQSFSGIYGMDFVPRFKHQYTYGLPPEGLERKELLQLENHIPFRREKPSRPSQ